MREQPLENSPAQRAWAWRLQAFGAVFLALGFISVPIMRAATSAPASTPTHAKPQMRAFPQVECGKPSRFSKAQRENLIYAYNFGAARGMGYTMAAIAWKESCAGAYMLNFSDPSAGLYHAHIPVVLKYYSSYKDSAFTRNVMGQILIDNRQFASQVALDSLLYWHGYHKGNHKNIIKSYNKGFKWERDKASNTLAESYYLDIMRKIRALESYIPKYSRVKNQSTLIEIHDKNKSAASIQRQALQNTQNKQNATSLANKGSGAGARERKNTTPKSPAQQNSAPKSAEESKQNPNNKHQSTRESNPKNLQNDFTNDFVDLPLEGGLHGGLGRGGLNSANSSVERSGNFDDNFEDFTLIFEGN